MVGDGLDLVVMQCVGQWEVGGGGVEPVICIVVGVGVSGGGCVIWWDW